MASVATFPNPYLVAILLVCNTRSGSGAQLLFHHPPRPLSNDNVTSSTSSVTEQMDDDSSTDSEESTTEDDDLFASSGVSSRPGALSSSSVKINVNDEDNDRVLASNSSPQNLSSKQNADTLFGLAEDGLVSLLSPERIWDKRKFEMGINGLTFVGRPVFARSDGSWRKRRQRARKAVNNEDPSASETATDNEISGDTNDISKPKTNDGEQEDVSTRSPLTMFHVVFVMNPPSLEHTLRVKDMYDHVIKKLTRALRWEQGRNDFVRKEAEKMSALRSSALAKRSSASTLCNELLAKSSLALAIANVYNAISSSRIARVTLSRKASFSLQIPPVTSTSYLPSLTDPPIQPGLWVTTATDIGSIGGNPDAADPDHALHVAKHYTLLLKSPPHRIAKDAIEAGGPLAAHLPKFVSSLRPTISFHKLSISSQTSLADIQVLARHLIYWRRAVAIPPLHSKDVYVVSPNADMSKLREASKSYEQQFAPTMPNMPSLPKILSILSLSPRAFINLIPSSDHKEIYFLALAWLLRNGWVTQLRTFVYVRVDPEVKRAVSENDRDVKFRNMPRTKDHPDEAGTGRDLGKPRKRPSLVSRPSSDGRRSIDGNWPTHNPRMASLILNPPRASPMESKWLDKIESMLVTEDDSPFPLSAEDRAEFRKFWPSFVKYFNGQIALETVPVREGLKRKFFWNLLNKIGLDPDRGVEDEDRDNNAILVTVRHW